MSEIIHGDCLDVLSAYHDDSVDLVYLDPPFNTRRTFTDASGSFTDTWHGDPIDDEVVNMAKRLHGIGMASYLSMIAVRLDAIKRVLASDGSIYLHCDQTASHYVKLLMDAKFGHKQFCNEIVWCYGGRGMARGRFNRKHDVILFYKASPDGYFNDVGASRPVAPEHVARYDKISAEGNRYARIKNKDGSYSNIFLKDVIREDWWTIPYVRGKERVGYPTQKPIELLNRIIMASSDRGGIVLDPFCGSGTTCLAAHRLGRKFIGIDISADAVKVARRRIMEADAEMDSLI